MLLLFVGRFLCLLTGHFTVFLGIRTGTKGRVPEGSRLTSGRNLGFRLDVTPVCLSHEGLVFDVQSIVVHGGYGTVSGYTPVGPSSFLFFVLDEIRGP